MRLILAALLAFSFFDGVRSRATFAQDHTLLARAAASVGDDPLAWTEAAAALQLQPTHPDALRIAIASYFNLLLAGPTQPDDDFRWQWACMNWLIETPHETPDLTAIAVLTMWRNGDTEMALKIWRQLGSTPSALAARLLVHDNSASAADLAALPLSAWDQPLVRLAAVQLGVTPPAGVTLDSPARVADQVKRIFSPAPISR